MKSTLKQLTEKEVQQLKKNKNVHVVEYAYETDTPLAAAELKYMLFQLQSFYKAKRAEDPKLTDVQIRELVPAELQSLRTTHPTYFQWSTSRLAQTEKHVKAMNSMIDLKFRIEQGQVEDIGACLKEIASIQTSLQLQKSADLDIKE
jgi:hypothetical protein